MVGWCTWYTWLVNLVHLVGDITTAGRALVDQLYCRLRHDTKMVDECTRAVNCVCPTIYVAPLYAFVWVGGRGSVL